VCRLAESWFEPEACVAAREQSDAWVRPVRLGALFADSPEADLVYEIFLHPLPRRWPVLYRYPRMPWYRPARGGPVVVNRIPSFVAGGGVVGTCPLRLALSVTRAGVRVWAGERLIYADQCRYLGVIADYLARVPVTSRVREDCARALEDFVRTQEATLEAALDRVAGAPVAVTFDYTASDPLLAQLFARRLPILAADDRMEYVRVQAGNNWAVFRYLIGAMPKPERFEQFLGHLAQPIATRMAVQTLCGFYAEYVQRSCGMRCGLLALMQALLVRAKGQPGVEDWLRAELAAVVGEEGAGNDADLVDSELEAVDLSARVYRAEVPFAADGARALAHAIYVLLTVAEAGTVPDDLCLSDVAAAE
jgi:hypothetical protein